MKQKSMAMKTYAAHNKFRAALFTLVIGMGTVLASCVDSKDPYDPNGSNTDPSKVGTLVISSLDREGDFVVKSSGAETDQTKLPDVDTFRVALLDYKTGAVIKNKLTGQVYQWEKFSELSGQTQTIPSGKYKLEAANVAKEPLAAWEAPYYYGIKDVVIRISDLSRETVVCKLANVKVTVEYDEEFLRKVDNPNVEVYFDYTDAATATKYKANLFYPVGEKKAGYFKVPGDGKLYVKVTGIRKEDGKPLSNGDGGVGQTSVITGVTAMQWQKVKVRYEQSGQVESSITVDYTTIDSEHQVEIPDGDDIIDGGPNNDNWDKDPSDGGEFAIVGADFNGAPFDLLQRQTVSLSKDNTIDVRFDAPKGIDQLYVTIRSEPLTTFLPGLGLAVNVPFDIANPPASTPETDELGEMWWVKMFADPNVGIGILDPNVPIKGKTTHTFSVGALMVLLGVVAEPVKNGPSEHEFGLKMVDAAGAVKEATLSIYLTE